MRYTPNGHRSPSVLLRGYGRLRWNMERYGTVMAYQQMQTIRQASLFYLKPHQWLRVEFPDVTVRDGETLTVTYTITGIEDNGVPISPICVTRHAS